VLANSCRATAARDSCNPLRDRICFASQLARRFAGDGAFAIAFGRHFACCYAGHCGSKGSGAVG